MWVGRVEIPHQDGMLPLVSTFPLHNIRFLLSEPVYRQQHVCSNIITASERAPLLDEGFLGTDTILLVYTLNWEARLCINWLYVKKGRQDN